MSTCRHKLSVHGRRVRSAIVQQQVGCIREDDRFSQMWPERVLRVLLALVLLDNWISCAFWRRLVDFRATELLRLIRHLSADFAPR